MRKQFKHQRDNLSFLLVWLGLSLVALGVTKFLVQGYDFTTGAGIDNASPVFSVTPSDSGSDASTPTEEKDVVTFTATGKDDENDDDYYLAICNTDAIITENERSPRCGSSGGFDDAWAVSETTTSGTGVTDLEYYVTGNESCDESCDWYAYVCDKLPTDAGPLCFPTSGSGDTGLAIGTVTFSDIPADGAKVQADQNASNVDLYYEFDTNSTCTGSSVNICVDLNSAEDEIDTAAELADEGVGNNSSMFSRLNVVYIYADDAGAGGSGPPPTGNSITLAESGDTGNDIALSGSTLSGGSDSNMAPFNVNHAPIISAFTITDTLNGDIQPGEILKFTATIADDDTNFSQDTVSMYVCTEATTGYSSGCTNGSLVCSSTGQAPGAGITCNESGNNLVPNPSPDGVHEVKVFVIDSHSMQSFSDATRNYTVTDQAPVVTNFTLPSTPSIAAGDFEVVECKATITDSNLDTDIIEVDGVFFDNATTSSACSADDNECYKDASCTLTEVDGIDNSLVAVCQMRVYFNANASSDWRCAVNVDDEQGTTSSSSGSGMTISSLSGIGGVSETVDYVSVEPSETSGKISTSMTNMGNQVIDVWVDGTLLTCSAGDCGANTIPLANLKWYNVSSSSEQFDDTEPSGSPWNGPWELESSAGNGATTLGCANRDIAVRDAHTSAATNEAIYFQLQAPETKERGTYSGSVSFTSTGSSSCTDAPAI